ncbi:hypothetical protein [Mailhella sp.]|uniref:hypothetical protein n=1 Tax=Mailhella sp. TaxID=1981029 RepID=UPI004063602A
MGRWDYSWRLSFFLRLCLKSAAPPEPRLPTCPKGLFSHRITVSAMGRLCQRMYAGGAAFFCGDAYKDWAAEAENAARSAAG